MIKVTSKEEKLDHAHYKSERLRRVFDVTGELDRRCSMFDHYGVDEVIHFYGFGVNTDIRRRGIGEKLMKAALSFVRNLNLGNVVIKGEGKSNYSKRVFEKLGFESLSVYIDLY